MLPVLSVTLTPIPESPTVEPFLSYQDIKYLRWANHAEKFLMIGLLDLLLFQLTGVTPLYKLATSSIVDRLGKTFLPHLLEDGPLFLQHLPVQGEELRSLLSGQTCLLGDKLLHFCLELLRRELPGFLSLRHDAQQEAHHTDEDLLHISIHSSTFNNLQMPGRHRCPDCRASCSQQPHRRRCHRADSAEGLLPQGSGSAATHQESPARQR